MQNRGVVNKSFYWTVFALLCAVVVVSYVNPGTTGDATKITPSKMLPNPLPPKIQAPFVCTSPSILATAAQSQEIYQWIDIDDRNIIFVKKDTTTTKTELQYYDLGDDGLPKTGDDRGPLTIFQPPLGEAIWPSRPRIFGKTIVFSVQKLSGAKDIYFYHLGNDGIGGINPKTGMNDDTFTILYTFPSNLLFVGPRVNDHIVTFATGQGPYKLNQLFWCATDVVNQGCFTPATGLQTISPAAMGVSYQGDVMYDFMGSGNSAWRTFYSVVYPLYAGTNSMDVYYYYKDATTLKSGWVENVKNVEEILIDAIDGTTFMFIYYPQTSYYKGTVVAGHTWGQNVITPFSQKDIPTYPFNPPWPFVRVSHRQINGKYWAVWGGVYSTDPAITVADRGAAVNVQIPGANQQTWEYSYPTIDGAKDGSLVIIMEGVYNPRAQSLYWSRCTF